jgi:2-octaprenyl-6-methoxyphenol hydroxylase
MSNTKKSFDIIISGGGLSGSLMALSLADLTKADGSLLSIAIIEANAPAANETANTAKNQNTAQQQNTSALFDDRVLALSHASAKYLDSVNVWQHLSPDACAIEKIDISDRGHYGKARIEAKTHEVSALGYVIAMAKIGQALLKVLASKSNVQWFSPDAITAINWHPKSTINHTIIDVTLNTGNTLQTSLLLGCDGVNSPCRQLAKISVNKSDYQQVALIANVATEKPHNNKAFERFTELGPIAMLPLTELNNTQNRCSLVWTMSAEQSGQLLTLNDTDFCAQLELAFGSWLGEITQVGKRHTYPLVLLQAQQQTYHRMALIGNASHTIHPIAGQGFNLGLRDVQLMASLIENQLQNQPQNKSQNQVDIGSFALLNEYSLKRAQDQTQIINLTDSLVTLFSNSLPPMVVGRNTGLKILNYLSPLKKTLVNKLMGY